MKIPVRIKVGGQTIEVRKVERLDRNYLGQCRLAEGVIEVAEKYDRNTPISETCQINSFFHETVHAILGTMGEDDLNNNEKFVCTFSSFLTEIFLSIEYDTSNNNLGDN
ncbi:MAG: hypothetical protein IKY94_11405 [Lachnospiraceae bacterium]|nr:hypothetical protein [Lachnospiraceae bacterium]